MNEASLVAEVATNSGPIGGVILVLFWVAKGMHARLEAKLDKFLEQLAGIDKRLAVLEARPQHMSIADTAPIAVRP